MIKVSVEAKQTFDDAKAALASGDRKKTDRIFRTASRQGISMTEVFAVALASRKPAQESPAPDVEGLSKEINTSSLTAEKAMRYAITATKRGERSKAAAILRHAVHQGISPADLVVAGLEEATSIQKTSSPTSSPVISESGAEVPQSKTDSSTSEEEST